MLAYWYVRDSNTAGCAGLCQAEALHYGAAEADFEELLHMVGKGGPSCHNQAYPSPQPGFDLTKHQLVEEWGSLQEGEEEVYGLQAAETCYCQDE